MSLLKERKTDGIGCGRGIELRSRKVSRAFKLGADDVRVDLFAVDLFFKVELVIFGMFVAEDHIIAFVQPF